MSHFSTMNRKDLSGFSIDFSLDLVSTDAPDDVTVSATQVVCKELSRVARVVQWLW